MPLESKHTEASISPNLTDLLYLQLTEVPRSPDLAIFVSTTTTSIALCDSVSAVLQHGHNYREITIDLVYQARPFLQLALVILPVVGKYHCGQVQWCGLLQAIL